jgi:hypothetical protein
MLTFLLVDEYENSAMLAFCQQTFLEEQTNRYNERWKHSVKK